MDPLIEVVNLVLAAGPPLRLAVLFGSRATKKARPDSDVDIAIIPRDAKFQFGDEMKLASELSKRLRQQIDLVRADQASTLLRFKIAKEGVMLMSAPAYEWTRFRATAAAEHAEIVDMLERTTKLFRQRPTRRM
jgi:predicted nucleotidyltransferase